MSSTMRAIVVDDANKNSASSLSIGEISRPKIEKPHQAMVKIKAFGLNRMDIMQRKGQYPLPPGAPTTLGVEFSGTIEETGEDASEYKKGDEVFGLAYGGAYAEYIVLDSGMLTRKPAELTFEQAAAIPEAWLTAFQALFLVAGMKEGDRVLIHAGASGVGVAANQLARGFGAKEVFTTAGSKDKTEFLKKLGADHAINYKEQKFSDEIQRITNGEGVNVIIDFIGPDYFEMNLASAAKDAHMVMLGLLSGPSTKGPINLAQLLYKRMRIEGTTLRSRSVEYQTELLQRFSKEALPKVIKGHYELVLHKVLPWDKIVEATEIIEGAGNTGKVVCTVD